MKKEEKYRDLSGIFFREKVGDKWENVCFEELSEESQNRILGDRNPEFVKNLAKLLAKTIIEIGNQFNLQK